MNFVAIDFETANPDFSSICQVGFVEFQNGAVVATWETLVDPQDWFCDSNVEIHGIDEFAVRGAPTWPVAHQQLCERLKGRIVVHHTAFDKAALTQACSKHSLEPPACQYLDSARVTRRAWPEFARSGYGLKSISAHLHIAFKHHNAMEDARAAGMVVVHALNHSGKTVEEWCSFALTKLAPPPGMDLPPDVNVHGHLYGECIGFTGSLQISRAEAARLAAAAGCVVGDGVTKHTTLLVVGDQDVQKILGYEKSAKHRKAEALIAKGKPIRIVRETDFFKLIA